MSTLNDNFARTVTLVTFNDRDVYTVTGENAAEFTVDFPFGTLIGDVMNSINAMAPANYVAPATIPDVTKRQMLVWLYQNLGKTDADIEAAIQTIPDPTESAVAIITWQNPDGPFRRSDPLFDELAPIFGLSSAQVDAAFVAASSL